VNIETLGQVARYIVMIAFPSNNSRSECQCRQWLFTLYLYGYISDYIQLAGTYFPPHIYALFIMAKNAVDAFVGLASDTAYFAVIISLAKENNTTHVIMKMWGLSFCCELVAMGVRFPVLNLIDGKQLLT